MVRQTIAVPPGSVHAAVSELFASPCYLHVGDKRCHLPDYRCVKVEIVGEEVVPGLGLGVCKIIEVTYSDQAPGGRYVVTGKI